MSVKTIDKSNMNTMTLKLIRNKKMLLAGQKLLLVVPVKEIEPSAVVGRIIGII